MSKERFQFNLGCYQIRKRKDDKWVPSSTVIASTYPNAAAELSQTMRDNPGGEYALFYLNDDEVLKRIEWTQASHLTNYYSSNREELHRIFYKLGLELNDHGYTTLAKITGISPHTLRKINRRPEDSRASILTEPGLTWIKYCVQEHLEGKANG
ncbi:hypothetical protein [Marinobacterium stanieri]|uniref:Uncharacterized protein n=1 Tax=Marinobacterium stanieri TaxID=49186 RepID=A0A1N6XJK6_9GAMM|nr:hypothetical protein [Marinobacterium stanieri]SIR02566.1 hypothetical protein SAMN05421647_11464 [Marinobacterium stanieri]